MKTLRVDLRAKTCWLLAVCLTLLASLICRQAAAQKIDWDKTATTALSTLQQYIRIDSTNPPGDTRKTAELLEAILTREGISTKRYQSTPNHVILMARLSANAPVAGRKPIDDRISRAKRSN